MNKNVFPGLLIFQLALASGLLFITSNTSNADVFTIPNPENSSAGIPRPQRGLSMEQVLTQFGAPLKRSDPVGNPPITRWHYQEFIVNFEGKWVIHAGVKRK